MKGSVELAPPPFVMRNPKVIYDIDDAIFMKAQSMVNRSADFIRGRSKPFFLMRLSLFCQNDTATSFVYMEALVNNL